MNSENIQQSLAGENNAQPENPISQNISPQINVDAILNLLKLVYQYAKKDGVNFSELEELVNIMEQQLEEK